MEPDDPRVHNALGLKALEAGHAVDAIDHFLAATSLDPRAAPLWMNLAKARRLAGDDGAERVALEQTLAIDQIHLMANIRLAELHERRGEHGAATDYWNRVLALCAQIANPSPELQQMLSHAQAYVDDRRAAYAEEIDNGLAAALGRASERDRRRIRTATDVMIGRRKIYSNQCHGFHYPFLPADEFFDRSHFPWLERLEAETAVIRGELREILASADPGLEPYIDMPAGTPVNLWSELDKSPDWSALHLWRDGTRIDAVCERAPRTAELVGSLPLAHIPGRAPAVFFSALKAGKRIPPHTGVTNIRSIVHLPLIVPDGCGFRVGGETRRWREDEAFVFDDTIEHEAWNDSDEDRVVLILDCWNPHLSEAERQMIVQIFAISEAQRPDRPVR